MSIRCKPPQKNSQSIAVLAQRVEPNVKEKKRQGCPYSNVTFSAGPVPCEKAVGSPAVLLLRQDEA